jgi:hypothetical protein
MVVWEGLREDGGGCQRGCGGGRKRNLWWHGHYWKGCLLTWGWLAGGCAEGP